MTAPPTLAGRTRDQAIDDQAIDDQAIDDRAIDDRAERTGAGAAQPSARASLVETRPGELVTAPDERTGAGAGSPDVGPPLGADGPGGSDGAPPGGRGGRGGGGGSGGDGGGSEDGDPTAGGGDPTLGGAAGRTPTLVTRRAGSPSRKMTRRQWVVGAVIVAALVFLLVKGIGSALQFYLPVNKAVAERTTLGTSSFRIEGKVVPGTVRQIPGGVAFSVTAGGVTVPVHSIGNPPQLFAAGIEVVLAGHFATRGSTFYSNQILVKHSSTYLPATSASKGSTSAAGAPANTSGAATASSGAAGSGSSGAAG